MNFGEKIKYVRELRDLTQTQLAELCDLAPSFISQIENNKRRPATEALTRIATALRSSAWYFLDEKAITFDELSTITKYETPADIVDFFSKQENLAYAVMAKDMKEQQIDPSFLRDLIETIKRNQPK